MHLRFVHSESTFTYFEATRGYVHRQLEDGDDLNSIFTWQEPRKVNKSLTLQYDKFI